MLNQMWRALAVFRVVALGYAAVLIVRDHDQYAHPAAGLLVLAGMACWTLVTVIAYARPAGRAPWMIAADVAVAMALIVSTGWIDSGARINAGSATLPAIWAAASVLASALAGGPWMGLAAALAIIGADAIEHPRLQLENTALLLIAGGVVGYLVRLVVRAEEAASKAARREAAAAERERLARSLHDSVLQVLALVTSRGRALGGEAAELGRLAAEQEAALRALVSGVSQADGCDAGQLDVRALTEPLADGRITVACPATAVLLPEHATRALVAAAAAAVDNVRRHAGADARCWVLLEDDAAAVLLTVRDDGCGFAAGRLAEAAAAGRLGVAQSIVGRLESIGGSALVLSAPGGGTEVELRVPRG
jgi:signal transduction histidine kinase